MTHRGGVVLLALVLLVFGTAGFLASTRAGASLLLWALEHQSSPVSPDRLKGRVDVIAVIGGRTARIHHAARLHLATGVPMLIAGKGMGEGGFAAESEKMEDILLREYGVGPRWVETESKDTRQNAFFSWCLVAGQGVSRVALVTDPHHMPRARAQFEAVGFRVVAAPTTDQVNVPWRPRFTWSADDFLPSREGWQAARRPVLEWAGAAAAVVAGAIFPRPSCP